MKLNLEHAAILLWLPAGAQPDEDGPDDRHLDGDPPVNPVACWTLGEALAASRNNGTHHKHPWIKVGGVTLSPDETLVVYEAWKHGAEIVVQR